MPVEIPTLSVAPSTIVCRLASGDLLDASPAQAAALILNGLSEVGIGLPLVSGSILALNTITSPLEFVESVFNAGLSVPAGTIAGFVRVEIGGNILFINAYSVIPS